MEKENVFRKIFMIDEWCLLNKLTMFHMAEMSTHQIPLPESDLKDTALRNIKSNRDIYGIWD